MSALHAGAQIRLSSTGELLTVWSAAHCTGCYWVHRATPAGDPQRPLLVRVRHTKTDPYPIVTLVEDQ